MFSKEESEADGSHASSKAGALVPAILAGLLAIAGAFLLVTYLRGNDASAQNTAEETRQVLVVTNFIPKGTTVDDLLAEPLNYLAARNVPEQFAATNAIGAVEELQDLGELMLGSDALPGEQLSRNRFVEQTEFEAGGFIDRAAIVEPPPGHHTVVLNLPAVRALGGNIRAGGLVTVVGSFRVLPTDGDPFEISMVVLPAVEVIEVATALDGIGELSADANSVGVASTADFAITVAVTSDELTELVYTIENGSIVLAAALDEADNDDPRSATVLESILFQAEFDEDEVEAILGGFQIIKAGDDDEADSEDPAIPASADSSTGGVPDDAEDGASDEVSDDEAGDS